MKEGVQAMHWLLSDITARRVFMMGKNHFLFFIIYFFKQKDLENGAMMKSTL